MAVRLYELICCWHINLNNYSSWDSHSQNFNTFPTCFKWREADMRRKKSVSNFIEFVNYRITLCYSCVNSVFSICTINFLTGVWECLFRHLKTKMKKYNKIIVSYQYWLFKVVLDIRDSRKLVRKRIYNEQSKTVLDKFQFRCAISESDKCHGCARTYELTWYFRYFICLKNMLFINLSIEWNQIKY